MGADLTGKSLGPFIIEGRLGQGAMGTVYRARHSKTGKPAAIKVMSTPDGKPNDNLAARFEREIKLLSQFRHPNIVRTFGDSTHDGIRYYAMELVEGQSLQGILDSRRKLSFQRTIAYAIQICEALQEIHGTGVVHRDLKPGNLLVTEDHKIKLTDFGIAKNVASMYTTELTQADHTVGTVAYMSPEQLAGQELTRKSDIYSLAILLYRMLTGRLPFTGETMFEYMNQRMAGTYARPSDVDPNIPLEFDELLAEMLAQDPLDRPRDAYVVMARLLEINKKAKEGTLLKTKPKTTDELAETLAMPAASTLGTLLKTVIGGGDRKGKGKSKGDKVEKGPFHESPWFLGGVLAAILVFVVYMLWPAGPEKMIAEGDKLMASTNYPQWKKAVDEYYLPVLNDHPEFAQKIKLKERVEEIIDKINMAEASGVAKQAVRFNLRRPEAGQAEQKYIDALMIQQKYEDPTTARERFKAIIDAFGTKPSEEDRPWVLLARQQFQDEKVQTDDERVEAKRAAVSKALAQAAKDLESGQKGQALRTYAALEELYKGDPDVADLISSAAPEFKKSDE